MRSGHETWPAEETMHEQKRVVVITGASAGLGRAIAREFAREGARIGLLARGLDGLEGAKREVEALGGEALVLPVDVSDPEKVFRAAEIVESVFGPIDVWVNNAMVSVFSPVSEMKPEEYKRVTEVTYLGYVYGTLAALRSMKPRNKGHIIQIGSALSYRSIPLQSAYCAAKHAINGFTESLRVELISEKSDVNLSLVQMPALNTPQFSWVKMRLPNDPRPVAPIFQPEVGARAVLWVSHHPRRETYVGFPTFKAVLADKLAPGIADRYLAYRGYKAQQTNEKADIDRVDNLWSPVRGDYGAHGVFDDQSKSMSLQFWISKNRWTLGTLAALIGSAVWFATGARKGGNKWLPVSV